MGRLTFHSLDPLRLFSENIRFLRWNPRFLRQNPFSGSDCGRSKTIYKMVEKSCICINQISDALFRWLFDCACIESRVYWTVCELRFLGSTRFCPSDSLTTPTGLE